LSPLETLPTKGVYTLIIFLNKKIYLKVQKLGCFNLQKGYYTYTGSALGRGAVSLKRRVARHLRKKKSKHWHIDFFLANRYAKIIAVVAAGGSASKECQVNNVIENIEGATVPIAGFGASDCKQNCQSHLVHFGDENIREEVVDAYTRLSGTSTIVSLPERVKTNCR